MSQEQLIADHKAMRKTSGHFDVMVSLIHAALAAGFSYAAIDKMERTIYHNDPVING